MASENFEIVQEQVPQVEEEENFDQDRFLSAACDEQVLQRPTNIEKEPEKPIHPANGGQKKRRLDLASPSFGQFTKTITGADGSSTVASKSYDSIGPLKSGPYTLCHISNQIHGVDVLIRQLVASLPSGPSGESASTGTAIKPSLDDVVKDQKAIKSRLEDMSRRLGKIERWQQKFEEHEKKKSKFLNKSLNELSSFLGSDDSDDSDDD